MGWGADQVLMQITGVDEKTIRRGREELAASLVNRPVERIRQPGAGRPPVEKNAADLDRPRGVGRPRNGRRSDNRAEMGAHLLARVEHQVGSGRSRRQFAHARTSAAQTRLLAARAKKIEASSNHPDREQQFDYIAVQRAIFTAAGLPILSVDTKKKELVGNFKNAGQVWAREPTSVNVHDYPHDALGRAVPYMACTR